MFRTSNPAVGRHAEVFAPAQTWDDVERQGRGFGDTGATPAGEDRVAPVSRDHATIQGTTNKAFFLLCCLVPLAMVGWNGVLEWGWNPLLVVFGGAIAGLLTALVCIFAPKSCVVTAPVYAGFQGLFLGGLSALYAARFAPQPEEGAAAAESGAIALNTGLILNAVLLTSAITVGVLAAYRFKLVRPGRTFYSVVIAGTIGACLFGLVAFGAALFGYTDLISVYDPGNGGVVSIGFSLLLVVLASANLFLDFDLINNAARNRAEKYWEWYGAFSLMVTLVWLYIEVLRLLAKLQSRD